MPSFSPDLDSSHSNAFSLPLLNAFSSSFELVGQSEPRVSAPVNQFFSENILPGQVLQDNPPLLEDIKTRIDKLEVKMDTVSNQQKIIDILKTSGTLIDQTTGNATSLQVQYTAVDNGDAIQYASTGAGQQLVLVDEVELTIAELEKLKETKKKGTTDAYFAVILLKHTTSEERTNCTVYGEGPKSRGLKKDTLFKIKRGYELMYSQDSWKDAIDAMNNHLRKYCSNKHKPSSI